MNWTDERVELLRKLWSEGLSASQIAARLGGAETVRLARLIRWAIVASGTRNARATSAVDKPAR